MANVLTARAALLLALDLPGFGLQLIERVRRATAGRARLGMGSVYPTLNRLEKEGLVRSGTGRVGAAGRPAKHYELTAKGITASREVREALLGLLRTDALESAAPEEGRVRRRVERCAAVSSAALELRRRVLARGTRG